MNPPSSQAIAGAGVDCNMDWNAQRGWHIVTAIKLSPKAFQTVVERCHKFYSNLLKDLHQTDPARDQIAASVLDLKRNRVVNKVTSNLQQGF